MDFSVLISVYYKENSLFLQQALDSVFKQTVPPNEVVLVKDGILTHELDRVIDEYQKNYKTLIKIISLKENGGLGNALSEGLKHCSYNWVARMDSDDICYPERFEKQLKFLQENKEISVVGSFISEFNNETNDIKSIRKLPKSHYELEKFSRERNPLNHMTVMFNRKVIENCGSYRNISLFEDYHLWLRVIKNGYKIANIPEALIHVRIGNNMIGRRHGYIYIKKELFFYSQCIHEDLLSINDAIIAFLIRALMRLLPSRILSIIYRKYLRT